MDDRAGEVAKTTGSEGVAGAEPTKETQVTGLVAQTLPRVGGGTRVSGRLEVYLGDVHCGHLVRHQDDGGEKVGGSQLVGMAFAYDPDFLRDFPGRLLSLSLPAGNEPFSAVATRPFFRGLLPEGLRRDRIETTYRLPAGDDFALLVEIGGDCPGAVSVLPEGEQPLAVDNGLYEPTEKELMDALRADLPLQPQLEGREGKRRLSMAGAQPKEGIFIQAGEEIETGRIFTPRGDRASTHILKPALGEYRGIARNEYFAMKLAERLALAVPACGLRTIDGIDCFVIERFDRIVEKDAVSRRHQEDFVQASGNIEKYESFGGPSFDTCSEVVSELTTPAIDIPRYVRSVLFNFFIANADMHAKNLSLFLDADGKKSMTPSYDLICTAQYTDLTTEMAMSWGGEFNPWRLTEAHVTALATSLRIGDRRLRALVRGMADEIIPAAEELRHHVPRDVALNAKITVDIIKRRVQFISDILGFGFNIEVDAPSSADAWR